MLTEEKTPKKRQSSTAKKKKKRKKPDSNSEITATENGISDGKKANGALNHIPSVKRAPKKRKTSNSSSSNAAPHVRNGARNFPLARTLQLPSKSDLNSLSSEEQRSCFMSLGSGCERLLRLMEDVQRACGGTGTGAGAKDDASASEDAFIADLAKLRGLPFARRFSEQWLWKRISRCTEKQIELVEKMVPEVNMEKKRIRNKIASELAEELDGIREREALDEDGIQKLLICLDQVADVLSQPT